MATVPNWARKAAGGDFDRINGIYRMKTEGI
jgi:hypothetical protein